MNHEQFYHFQDLKPTDKWLCLKPKQDMLKTMTAPKLWADLLTMVHKGPRTQEVFLPYLWQPEQTAHLVIVWIISYLILHTFMKSLICRLCVSTCQLNSEYKYLNWCIVKFQYFRYQLLKYNIIKFRAIVSLSWMFQ